MKPADRPWHWHRCRCGKPTCSTIYVASACGELKAVVSGPEAQLFVFSGIAFSEAPSAGPWRIGDNYGAVVTDEPIAGQDEECRKAYGGYLVAESIAPKNRPLIAAAPRLRNALAALVRACNRTDLKEVREAEVLLMELAPHG